MPQTQDEIREILKDILEVKLSLSTMSDLAKGLGDKETVVKSLNEIKYDNMCKKPVLTMTELFDLPSQPNDYLIEKLLWKRNSIMYIAKDKVGKTINTLQMACALTCGDSYLDTYDISGQYNVLYVQCEGSRESTKERLQSMIKNKRVDMSKFFFMYEPSLQLHTQAGLKYFLDKISGIPAPNIIFFDPLYKSICGGNISDAKDATVFTDSMDRLKEMFNCAIVVVHHKRKSGKNNFGVSMDYGDEDSLGSSIFKNYFDHTINMRLNKDKTRSLTCTTQRNGDVEEKINLKLIEDPLGFEIIMKKASSGTEQVVLDMIKKKPISACEISAKTGIPGQTVYNVYSKLRRKGLIKKHSVNGRKTLYCLKGK